MKIDIVTIFPDMFKGPFDESIIRRAQDKLLVEIKIHDLRKWTNDKRGTVDDKPYGGGVGMVMMVEPIAEAIDSIKSEIRNPKSETKVILLSPRGNVWKQELAQEYAKLEHLILICGHYEGVDERIRNYIDEEISIGDFILTGGEIPAMVIIDSIVRLIPDVLKKPEATQLESFANVQCKILRQALHQNGTGQAQDKLYNVKLLEYPQYTHPENYNEMKVPDVLLSGNHKEIEKWRNEKAIEITKKVRPDLLEKLVKDF